MKLRKDFHIYSTAGQYTVDLLSATNNYRLTGGPEQPVRYMVLYLNRPALSNAYYADWVNTIVEGQSATNSASIINLDAMDCGTFIITQTATEDNMFIVYAYGVELLLNSATLYATSELVSTSQTSGIGAIESINYLLGGTTDASSLTKQCYPSDYIRAMQLHFLSSSTSSTALYPKGKVPWCIFRRKGINPDTEPTDTDITKQISFYSGIIAMASGYLCATADNAFLFFSGNPDYDPDYVFTNSQEDQNNGYTWDDNPSIPNVCYVVDYDGLDYKSAPSSAVEPIGYDVTWALENGVMNVYPEFNNYNREYTALDVKMYSKVVMTSSQDVYGSNTLINIQEITTVSQKDTYLDKDPTISKEKNQIAVNVKAYPQSIRATLPDSPVYLYYVDADSSVSPGKAEGNNTTDCIQIAYVRSDSLFDRETVSCNSMYWAFESTQDDWNVLEIYFGSSIYLQEQGNHYNATLSVKVYINDTEVAMDEEERSQTISSSGNQTLTYNFPEILNNGDKVRMEFSVSVDWGVTVINSFEEWSSRMYSRYYSFEEGQTVRLKTIEVGASYSNGSSRSSKSYVLDHATRSLKKEMCSQMSVSSGDGDNVYLFINKVGDVAVTASNIDTYLNPLHSSVSIFTSFAITKVESQASQEMYDDYTGTAIDASSMRTYAVTDAQGNVTSESTVPYAIAKNTVYRYMDSTQATTVTMGELDYVTVDGEQLPVWNRAFDDCSYIRKLEDDVNDIHLNNLHKCGGYDNTAKVDGRTKEDNSLLRLSTYTRCYPEMYTQYTFGAKDVSPLGTRIAKLQGT